MKLATSWSGGKDSCFALMNALAAHDNELAVIFTMMNENNQISRSHGLPHSILDQHAKQLNVPIVTSSATWQDYEAHFINMLADIKTNYKTDAVVFGDIDIVSHKQWEEKVSNASDHKALLPLWQKNRKALVADMVNSGIEAIITSCNMTLGEAFLGRKITTELAEELEALGIDACGENGEYHTLVVNCPLFKKPIQLPTYTKTTHEHYCFLTWDK